MDPKNRYGEQSEVFVLRKVRIIVEWSRAAGGGKKRLIREKKYNRGSTRKGKRGGGTLKKEKRE